MKYIVGYPMKENPQFLDCLIQNKKAIKEVYFSWGEMPNGRSASEIDSGLPDFFYQKRQLEDLKGLSDAGIQLNLLFNANCYGKDSLSASFFNKIGNITEYVRNEFHLGSVTTSSPVIAKFLKANFESVDVRASVNMEIGSIEGISYIAHLFDSFYVKRELNRNLPELLRLKKWCDERGKQMYLLANSGCLNHCSSHIFHDNLVAHESEISAMDNGYRFNGICWEFLSQKENFFQWLQKTNFIRPEDIHLYEEIVPAVKLATRVNQSPNRVLNAYIEGRYGGSVMELLEPNHSGLFYPDYLDNGKIGREFASHVMNCDKQCEECDYCKETMKKACVKLDGN